MKYRAAKLLLLLPWLVASTKPVSALPSTAFVYPIAVGKVSSGFGMRRHPITHRALLHNGVDLPAPQGTTVRVFENGEVIFTGFYSGYGNLVVVQHESHFTSLYAHLSTVSVSVGETITAGTIVGCVGSTGEVTGPHLHFEIRIGGVPIDPAKILTALSDKG